MALSDIIPIHIRKASSPLRSVKDNKGKDLCVSMSRNKWES